MKHDVIIKVCTRPSGDSDLYNITFSTGDTFKFTCDEVAEYGLYREGEVCGNFEEMCIAVLAKRMMAQVASYVLFSARTSFQVKKRIEAEKEAGKFAGEMERFFDSAEDEAIKRLEELKYIDDVKYAEKYASSVLSGKCVSKAFVLNELVYKKGIDRDIAEAAVNEAAECGYVSDEENAYKLLMKKTKGIIPEDRKDLEKLYRFAIGKGFTFGIIESAVQRIKEESTEKQ